MFRFGIFLIACLFGFTPIRAQVEPEKTSRRDATPIEVSVDVNASDLEAELEKALLLLRLREAELDDVIRRFKRDQELLDLQIEAMQNEVVVAGNRVSSFTEKQKELERDAKANSTTESKRRKNQTLQKMAVDLLATKEKELKSLQQARKAKTSEYELPLERARIAVELARNQWKAIDEKIKKRKLGKVVVASQPKTLNPLEAVGITKEDLADCKMHVIGLYSATNNQQDDQVFVEVETLDSPAVIVVSSYYETMWRIKLKNPSQVKLVIMTGYNAQVGTIEGSSKELPLLNLTYFGRSKQINRTGYWAYAYNWPTDEGRKMARMLYDITGLTASTFQGMNNARSLTIDGKKGRLTNRQAKEPIPGLLTAAELAAEPIEFPSGDAADQGRSSRSMGAVENGLDELYAAEAASKIAMRKVEAQIEESERQLKNLDLKIQGLATSARDSRDEASRSSLAKLVRDQFEKQQSHRASRIELSQYKLQLVEVRRLLRERDAEAIVEQRVKALLAEESQ